MLYESEIILASAFLRFFVSIPCQCHLQGNSSFLHILYAFSYALFAKILVFNCAIMFISFNDNVSDIIFVVVSFQISFLYLR